MEISSSTVVCAWAIALVACDVTAFSASERAPGSTPAAGDSAAHCNEPYAYEATPLAGANERAFLYAATAGGLTKDPPLPSVAHGGVFWFFLETKEDPEVDLRVEVTGDLQRTDESTGACWSYSGRAATHLQLVAKGEGEGSIEVFVNGALYDRFDLSIRRPTDLAIEWRPELGQGHALLRDREGEPLFAVGGITWRVAPSTRPELKEGVDGPFVTWDGDIDELRYMAFFGDLSASITVLVDPATGVFTPRTQR